MALVDRSASCPRYWPAGQLYEGPAGRAAYGKYQAFMRPTLDLLFQHATRFGTILHAGGHIGLMTLALAARFTTVYTFEPAGDNYTWLVANVAQEPRIHATYGALGDGQPVAVVRHKYSPEHHAKGPGDVPCYRLDDLPLPRLDAMVLDLEGGELVALRHARTLLACDHPLLVIEEHDRWSKRYGRRGGDVTRFLAEFGYVPVGRSVMDIAFAYEGTMRKERADG